jgi:hypothetical protein
MNTICTDTDGRETRTGNSDNFYTNVFFGTTGWLPLPKPRMCDMHLFMDMSMQPIIAV